MSPFPALARRTLVIFPRGGDPRSCRCRLLPVWPEVVPDDLVSLFWALTRGAFLPEENLARGGEWST